MRRRRSRTAQTRAWRALQRDFAVDYKAFYADILDENGNLTEFDPDAPADRPLVVENK